MDEERDTVQDGGEEEQVQMSGPADATAPTAEPFEGGGTESPDADPPIIISGGGAS